MVHSLIKTHRLILRLHFLLKPSQIISMFDCIKSHKRRPGIASGLLAKIKV